MINTSFGQQILKGTVSDQNGNPLIGVNVIEAGTNNGVVSDFEGNFKIEVKGANPSLIFTYLGFTKKQIKIGDQTTLSVVLEENFEQLSEVVITALGFEEDKDELGYASSTVSSQLVEGASETTIINALSGKASGVRISRNSGDPGAGAYIQLRGVSSIDRDAQPLIVVDGIPISNDSRGSQERFAAQSRLNDINPSDIESVTILKGASAAALWGTRALGGVIVIKTKSGKLNQSLKINYKTTYSLDKINVKYPQQTVFGQGDNGVYSSTARDSWGDKISDRSGGLDDYDTSGAFYTDQNGNIYYPILNKNSKELFNTSNFDQIFGKGHFLENNLSLSSGNESSSIFASLSDFDQQGIVKNNSDYRRTTARINVRHNLSDKLSLKASVAYTKSKSNRIARGAASSGLQLGLLRTPADFDISGYRGDYYASQDAAPIPNRHRSYRNPIGASDNPVYNNPLWTINEQENLVDVDRFVTSFDFNANPFSWLSLTARMGYDSFAELQTEFFTPGSASGDYRTGLFAKSLARNSIFNMDYIARAALNISSDISGSFLLGYNFNNRQLITDGSEIINFIQFTDVASPLRDIDNALPENRNVNSTYGEERTTGLYSSLNLDLYDQVFINATLRAETASTFGNTSDNTFYFPSVSTAWQFTEKKDLGVLSFGKLRASYGEVGVQPQRYKTSNNFISPVFSDQTGGSLSGELFGNGAFIPSSSRGSSILKPERKSEFEFGVDLRFFENKLSLSASRYANKTIDMLLDFPIANSRGVTSLYTNGAEMENKGLELDLNYKLISSEDWSWDVGFIYSQNRNLVTKLDSSLNINLGGLASASARAIEGYPLGVIVGGRILRDEFGDAIYDENGFPEQDPIEGIIGDPNPDWQGSLFSTLRYKNVSLSTLFETFQGADIFAGTKSVLSDLGLWESTAKETTANQNLLDFRGNVILAGTTFRGDIYNFGAGPVALTEAWYNGDGGYFGGGNDELYIEDGSWTRLREVTLAYTINGNWVKEKLKMSSLELSFTGRNLLLWTAFEGNDPDTNLEGVSVARGIDYFNNPGTKSYVFTLDINF
jgi:TonB-linked SusC/RagA family outer membrane protein